MMKSSSGLTVGGGGVTGRAGAEAVMPKAGAGRSEGIDDDVS